MFCVMGIAWGDSQINAFTDHASGGNPAAVCYLPHEKDDKWLQQIAREFNQPMTAFLVHRDANAESEQYDLRWFTSKAEVLVLNLFLAVYLCAGMSWCQILCQMLHQILHQMLAKTSESKDRV